MSTRTPANAKEAASTDEGSTDTPKIGPSSGPVVAAVGLVVLAIGLIVNSVAGPLLIDDIDYPTSDSMRNQTIGLDAAALFLFAPACLVTAVMVWRGHRLAPMLTVSLGSYTAYIFVQYLVGPEFGYYPATLLLHLGLFIGGWTLAVYAWHTGREIYNETEATLSPRHAIAAAAIAGFVLLRYLPGLAASLTQKSLPAEASGDITMYWLIVVSDLGVFIPIMVATAIGVRYRAPWGRMALTATAGWFALVSFAVAVMSLAMILNDDSYASRAQLGLFIIITAMATGYAIHLHRALFDQTR
ncbi:MAG: hypothetical protein ACRBK7_10845 [Acidimicrobiales bacterium]